MPRCQPSTAVVIAQIATLLGTSRARIPRPCMATFAGRPGTARA
ncbi:hypothetical protein [Allgaiera indica]|nr:hypothetical protein [Allgaiera indica]